MNDRIQRAEEWLSGKPPTLWKNGDVFLEEELDVLAKFQPTEVSKLMPAYKEGDRLVFGIAGIKCECGNTFEETCNKTQVIERLRLKRRDAREIETGISKRRKREPSQKCPQCRMREQQEADEQQRTREAQSVLEREERTKRFVDVFLDPSKEWVSPKREWFSTMHSELWGCCGDDIAAAIEAMRYSDFLQTPYWKAVAHEVRFKARFRCQLCNSGERLNVHHRTYDVHGKEHRHLNELICLCEECHHAHHREVSPYGITNR